MQTLSSYFAKYEKAHQHPMNVFFHRLGIPTIILSLVLLIFTAQTSLGWTLFAIGWVFQFIGHAIERTWPEFFSNPIYLVIGPMYFVHKIIKVKKAKSH